MCESDVVTPMLLKMASMGDEVAFRKIYNTIAGFLYSICLKYFPNKSEASDIFQDGVVKIFVNLGKFRGEGSFEGWAGRIMFTTCIDMLKKKKREFIDFGAELPDIMTATDPSGLEKLALNELFHVVEQMPPGYRNAFSMFYFHGLNHKEIANHLGISVGTSKAQLFRAKRYLQGVLDAKSD